jgi:hypothetical protein
MSIFHTRPMANKENSLHSTSCLPSFISKPTLSGLGRSPTKKSSSSIHGAKPYKRTASVHAKPIKNKAKAGKKVPPPLDLTKIRQAPVANRSEVKIPLSLPKVNIPLVPHLDEFFDGDIVCPVLAPCDEANDSHSIISVRNYSLVYLALGSFPLNSDLIPLYPFLRTHPRAQVWHSVYHR